MAFRHHRNHQIPIAAPRLAAKRAGSSSIIARASRITTGPKAQIVKGIYQRSGISPAFVIGIVDGLVDYGFEGLGLRHSDLTQKIRVRSDAERPSSGAQTCQPEMKRFGTLSRPLRSLSMTKQTDNRRTMETVEEARQGERKKGMPSVLAISTLLAALSLAIILVFLLV